LNRHLNILAGYNFNITNDLVIIPSVLIKSVATAFQIDINAKLKYQNKYWCGASYRRQDAIVFLAGLRISDILDVGYSYDITTSSLRIGSKGTHEIVIGARFKRKVATVCPSDYW
jgi:type IX secretion system PorP/SprF family membrane protein